MSKKTKKHLLKKMKIVALAVTIIESIISTIVSISLLF